MSFLITFHRTHVIWLSVSCRVVHCIGQRCLTFDFMPFSRYLFHPCCCHLPHLVSFTCMCFLLLLLYQQRHIHYNMSKNRTKTNLRESWERSSSNKSSNRNKKSNDNSNSSGCTNLMYPCHLHNIFRITEMHRKDAHNQAALLLLLVLLL